MKCRISTELGEIIVDTDVIAKYAGTNLSNGINVTVEDNRLCLDFHVIVAYGVSISAVSDNLIETVKYKVEEFTGIGVEQINIYVESVRVID